VGSSKYNFTILVADDDEDDLLLIQDALKDNGFAGSFRCVYDGRELMEALFRKQQQGASAPVAYPDLILLDLNMPKKDGRDALREIKADLKLNAIPVVVLTTSSDSRDINLCHQLGASSFITKPMSYDEWVLAMGSVLQQLSRINSSQNSEENHRRTILAPSHSDH
jgi:CheY-like chemotaxis protein